MKKPLLLIATLAFLGCQDDALEQGRTAFNSAEFSASSFNQFSCSTCHASTTTSKAVFPGYSLANAAFRDGYWGGATVSLLEAVNHCYSNFMRGEALTRDSTEGRVLYNYLVHLSPTPEADTLPFTIVENVAVLGKGDAVRGAEIYGQACLSCHGTLFGGFGSTMTNGPLLPQTTLSHNVEFGHDPGLVIIEKVRHGGFFGLGGVMPPFSQESLPDRDLRDIITAMGL